VAGDGALLDLAGRRVVVTGGSRGIGAACCRLFARAGAAVGVVFRESHVAAGALLSELLKISGDAPHWLFRADVARPDQVERLFAFIGREWGRLDCLVNNAGVWERNPLASFDLALYRRAMDTNVLAPFACTAAARPLLEASEDGNVVNLSSTAGQRGEAFYSPYAATKGAMISATKAWAVELAPAVRVNAVAPGWVSTDMSAEALEGPGREAIDAAIPLGRVATPEEIAGPVVFLASPLARDITGEILNVNGGAVLAG